MGDTHFLNDLNLFFRTFVIQNQISSEDPRLVLLFESNNHFWFSVVIHHLAGIDTVWHMHPVVFENILVMIWWIVTRWWWWAYRFKLNKLCFVCVRAIYIYICARFDLVTYCSILGFLKYILCIKRIINYNSLNIDTYYFNLYFSLKSKN